MGLDCSHDAFHGAYSAFSRLRKEVARAAGGSYPPHDDPTLDRDTWYWDGDQYSRDTHPGLYEFLSHSDCDGEISPEVCVLVARDLNELMPKISKSADWGHIERAGGYYAALHRFIAGCQKAAQANEPLVFG